MSPTTFAVLARRDLARNLAVHDDVVGYQFSGDARMGTDRQGLGGDVTVDDTIHLNFAFGLQIADDVQIGADDGWRATRTARRGGRRSRCFGHLSLRF